MIAYSVAGDSGTSGSVDTAILWKGNAAPTTDARIYSIMIGFDSLLTYAGPEGMLHTFYRSTDKGSGWRGGVHTPQVIDASLVTQASDCLFYWGGVDSPTTVTDLLLSLPVYWKGSTNWQAKKGKELSFHSLNGFAIRRPASFPTTFNYSVALHFMA